MRSNNSAVAWLARLVSARVAARVSDIDSGKYRFEIAA
jgi:hypothetical protein